MEQQDEFSNNIKYVFIKHKMIKLATKDNIELFQDVFNPFRLDPKYFDDLSSLQQLQNLLNYIENYDNAKHNIPSHIHNLVLKSRSDDKLYKMLLVFTNSINFV